MNQNRSALEELETRSELIELNDDELKAVTGGSVSNSFNGNSNSFNGNSISFNFASASFLKMVERVSRSVVTDSTAFSCMVPM